MTLNKLSEFIGLEGSYEESQSIVFGAPFDGTTSFRPGTRFAPNVMRLESDGIETYSPYLERDLLDYTIHDAGDLDLPFGNTERVMQIIEEYVSHVVKAGKRPVMIGGEHLVSYPAIKAVHQQYKDLVLLHFDAHADLREDYLGQKLSHATVIRRAWEFLGDHNIYQFGIRSGERTEFQWAKVHTFMEKFNCNTVKSVIDSIGDRPVYITIDLDILDPSIFAGTGTPEAGGVTFKELMSGIIEFTKLNVVGADVVELSPHYDQSGVSTGVACKVLREVLLSIEKNNIK